jgi:hypothetical protein
MLGETLSVDSVKEAKVYNKKFVFRIVSACNPFLHADHSAGKRTHSVDYGFLAT